VEEFPSNTAKTVPITLMQLIVVLL
jgi:hypothetical protein